MISANREFQNLYPRVFNISLGMALLLHAAAFAFAPEYVPRPYELGESALLIVDLTVEFEVPPPPPEIPRPQLPVEAMISDDALVGATIHNTLFDSIDDIPAPPVPRPQRTFPVDVLQEYPKPVYIETPYYPNIARQAGVEGTVVVRVVVDQTGKVISATIVRSDANVLNDAAIEAAYKCRFKPGLQADIPVKTKLDIPYSFRLR